MCMQKNDVGVTGAIQKAEDAAAATAAVGSVTLSTVGAAAVAAALI